MPYVLACAYFVVGLLTLRFVGRGVAFLDRIEAVAFTVLAVVLWPCVWATYAARVASAIKNRRLASDYRKKLETRLDSNPNRKNRRDCY